MLEQLIGPVTGLLDKFIEDKDKTNAIAFQISTMAEKHAQELAKAQLEVNKTEAAHKSLFVSGWRPAVGWTCCIGLASQYILIPMANFTLALANSTIEIPVLDMATMMPVLMGMLGLGAMRTVEKTKKVQRDR
ncbi:holin family protein [Akkermansiaceae bacterium]|nr:holin family protein [Akkermansiaceae bacterium]MDB4712448.1 holin family protein [Verrucomicrobiales bacterium]